MNYYSTGCQAPAKTLGIQDLTTKMVTIYHQDQRRSQRTDSNNKPHEASLQGPIGVDEENDKEDDTEDELEGRGCGCWRRGIRW